MVAGGPSSRFGGLPKGLQVVGGKRIIDRVADSLRTVADRLLVISNDEQAYQWLADAEVAGDVLPGRASLIGIHAALVHAAGDVIVLAWDMPFVPPGLVREFRDRLRGGASAVIPIGPNGPEPVCAAYAATALRHVERLASGGAFKLAELVDALPSVVRLTTADLSPFGDPAVMFFNVNRPGDLERAEAIASAL